MTLQIAIQRGADGYFAAHCPALKSCRSQGRTRDEALDNIRKAIALDLEPSPREVVVDEGHEVLAISL